MIKVNLLPQRKPKRVTPPGEKHIAIGMGALALAAGGVYMAVHRPKASQYNDVMAANELLQEEIAGKQNKLKGYEELKTVVEAAQKRSDAITLLNKAQIVPAHVLHELGEILTPNRTPTMSEEMSKRVGSGPQSDPNRRFQTDWDPHHIWINEFVEKGGEFTLQGGAQSDGDITQLSKRLQASVYFQNVTPSGAERITEANSTVTYYKFSITGKLVY
ncbi:MAG TPA: PilN domain-containing protein [Kofleriaceae bacterium]|nr:PilN domain-containing protein [Kofleriaceae bacterium]